MVVLDTHIPVGNTAAVNGAKEMAVKVAKHENFNLFVLLVMQKFLRNKNFEINVSICFLSLKSERVLTWENQHL